MKKLITTITALAIVSVSAYAQGYVNFANSSAAASKISTNSVPGGSATGLTTATAGSFYYALFYSSSATTVNGSALGVTPSASATGSYVWNDSNWAFAGCYATNATTVGRVSGNTSANGTGAVVTGVAGGASAYFVVVGWSANLGSTLAAMEASLASGTWNGTAWVGESAVSTLLQIGDGSSVSNPTLIAASGAVPGFTMGVVPVPEPGTIALACLGGASLLLFRRKK